MGNSSGATTNPHSANTPQSTRHPTVSTPRATPHPRLTRREALQKIHELLECSVCLEELKDPRLLPCHHSFCYQCLEQMQREYGRNLRCPNCNTLVRLQRNVNELPSDFRANSLQEYLPAQDFEETAPVTATPAFNIRNSALGMLTCPVCSNIFSEPRLLECGHSFCTSCLEFMMPLNGTIIYCPCCDGQTLVQNGVHNLPIDADKCFMIRAFSQESDSTSSTSLHLETENESTCDRTQRRISQSEREHSETTPPRPQSGDRTPSPVPSTERHLAMFIVILAAITGVSSFIMNLFLEPRVVTNLTPQIILIGALLIPVLTLNGTFKSNTNGANRNTDGLYKYAAWIGAIIGGEVMTSCYSYSGRCTFHPVVGCVFAYIFLTLKGNNRQTAAQDSKERLGRRTIPFILFWAVFEKRSISVFSSVLIVLYGGLLGALISWFIISLLKMYKFPVKLVNFNVLITMTGCLLGNIIMSVLSHVLNPGIGLTHCVVWGTLIGLGIGNIFEIVYVPLLRKIMSPAIPNGMSIVVSELQGRTNRGIFLAMGTFFGGVFGFVTTFNILACFVGAMLGLYCCEQNMLWIGSLFMKILKRHLHCVVGGFLGCVVAVAVGINYDYSLLAPILGCYLEAVLLQMYKVEFGTNQN